MGICTRLNEHQKSVQSYDLMSAVSEITKDTDQAINWPSVKFVGQENHSFTNDPQGHLHSRCVTINSDQWRQFMKQCCSLTKARLGITACK